MSLAVIILAAGKGTRMKSDLPKVLHKVAGKPMISYAVDLAKAFKPHKIVTVVAPQSSQIEKAAGTEIATQKSQNGTADAVKAAAANLTDFNGNVIILYADCPLVNAEALNALLETRKQFDISLIGFAPDEPGKYGRLLTNNDEVKEIIEFNDATEQQRKITLCNSGIYALDAKLLFRLLEQVKPDNAGKEFYLTDIIKIAAAEGYKTGFTMVDEEVVMGVNTKTELAVAERLMQQRLRTQAMLNGVTMIAPETVFISADTKFGRNVTINPHVVIGSEVEVGNDVQIGPFAHIRPGTVLKTGAKIGNFVEVKKSTIGENSKINHLSYIGDSTLGNDVNIGAGTITCNYDGFEKHQTTIGDSVFIGSNSSLVAPLTIESGAIIGAGSTITKNVSADELAISRGAQKNLAGGAIKFKKKKRDKK